MSGFLIAISWFFLFALIVVVATLAWAVKAELKAAWRQWKTEKGLK